MSNGPNLTESCFGLDLLDEPEYKEMIDYDYMHKQRRRTLKEIYKHNVISSPEARIYKETQKSKNGDKVIQGILESLSNLKGFRLYTYQLQFIKVCIPVLLKYIYRDIWNTDREDILKRNNFDRVYPEVFFRSPRRMGKTITLAFFCLAVVSNILYDPRRPYQISVFATTKDASSRFINECIIGWPKTNRYSDFNYDASASKFEITSYENAKDLRRIVSFCTGAVSCFIFIVRF